MNDIMRYYRVFRNDTSVTEVSVDDFSSSHAVCFKKNTVYSLPLEGMFYGYSNKIHAMEMAKAGALKYIGLLIEQGEPGVERLKQYRMDHFLDLNINLTESNTRNLEE